MEEHMTPQPPNGRWHVDRNVPLPLIVSLVILFGAQFFGFTWWASNLSERVAVLERSALMTAPQADRLTRVEVKVENIQSGVDDIKRLIRQRPSGPP